MKTTEEIVSRFIKVHGNKYSYKSVIYTRMKDKVTIICPIHGEFYQTPDHHLSGTLCPSCQRSEVGAKKKNHAAVNFITNAMKIHGDYYDYSQINYNGNKVKIKILCKKHGPFMQTPSNHLHGFGCEKCGRMSTSEKKRLDINEFYKKCKIKHNNYYKYKSRKYENADSMISVECPKHGSFQIKARNHLWIGQGCNKCYNETRGFSKRILLNDFLIMAKEIHGTTYEYDRSSYKMMTDKMKIKCEKHGWFMQKPQKHLTGQGCPKCARFMQKGIWQPDTLNPILKNKRCSLYYFKISNHEECFYKIGISNNVERRAKTIMIISDYDVEILHVKKSTYYKCMKIEFDYHDKYKEYSYEPKHRFPGYTECFKYDVLKEAIIKGHI